MTRHRPWKGILPGTLLLIGPLQAVHWAINPWTGSRATATLAEISINQIVVLHRHNRTAGGMSIANIPLKMAIPTACWIPWRQIIPAGASLSAHAENRKTLIIPNRNPGGKMKERPKEFPLWPLLIMC